MKGEKEGGRKEGRKEGREGGEDGGREEVVGGYANGKLAGNSAWRRRRWGWFPSSPFPSSFLSTATLGCCLPPPHRARQSRTTLIATQTFLLPTPAPAASFCCCRAACNGELCVACHQLITLWIKEFIDAAVEPRRGFLRVYTCIRTSYVGTYSWQYGWIRECVRAWVSEWVSDWSRYRACADAAGKEWRKKGAKGWEPGPERERGGPLHPAHFVSEYFWTRCYEIPLQNLFEWYHRWTKIERYYYSIICHFNTFRKIGYIRVLIIKKVDLS